MEVWLLTATCALFSLIIVSESNRKLWNQDYFTLTFPKPHQPGREKRSRSSELQTSVPVSIENVIFN